MSIAADPTGVVPSPVVSATERAIMALIEVIERSTTPEMIRSRQILARRLALSGDAVPSRLPAPLNITEVGGYINLLERMRERDTLRQTISAALGVAGPLPPDLNDPLGTPPPVTLVSLANQRPSDGPGLAAAPPSIMVRSDHAGALAAALATFAGLGCALPLVNLPVRLHPPGVPAPSDLLALAGRVLMVVPAAALRDPATDAVVVGRPASAGSGAPLRILLRPIGPPAAGVAPPPSAGYSVVGPSVPGGLLAEASQTLALFDPGAALGAAGWRSASAITLTSLAADTGWARLENIAGLVPDVTRLRDELLLMHGVETLHASNVFDALDFVWNGQAFVAS